jgi:HSP20 family protein
MFSPSLWRVRTLSGVVPEMLQLQREMNRLFSTVGQKSPQDYPAINIWEKDRTAIVTAEIPGIDPDKMDISVAGDVLTIAATSAGAPLAEGEVYLRQERGMGSFKRNIQLPYPVNAQAVEAKYEKGVLIIALPRIEEDQPRKIQIK